MAIKYTADNFTTDFTAGGGLNATNWSKTFPDYYQASPTHQYAHASGTFGYAATQHMPFYYSFEVLPRTDPGSGSYDSDGGNRYYPVSFQAGTVRRGSAMPNLVIYRGYNFSGPYQFEVKNRNQMKTIYDWYKQASKNTKLEPVVVMKMNTRQPLAVIDLDTFIDLIK